MPVKKNTFELSSGGSVWSLDDIKKFLKKSTTSSVLKKYLYSMNITKITPNTVFTLALLSGRKFFSKVVNVIKNAKTSRSNSLIARNNFYKKKQQKQQKFVYL